MCGGPRRRLCGGPYRGLDGVRHWLGCTAGYYTGYCGDVVGLRCGAGWYWWLTRGVNS